MIVKFNNLYLQRLFEGKEHGGKPRYSRDVILKVKKTVLMLKNTESIAELKKFSGLNFEPLRGNFKGFYSVRVDLQYRLILSVERNVVEITDILIIETH